MYSFLQKYDGNFFFSFYAICSAINLKLPEVDKQIRQTSVAIRVVIYSSDFFFETTFFTIDLFRRFILNITLL